MKCLRSMRISDEFCRFDRWFSGSRQSGALEASHQRVTFELPFCKREVDTRAGRSEQWLHSFSPLADLSSGKNWEVGN